MCPGEVTPDNSKKPDSCYISATLWTTSTESLPQSTGTSSFEIFSNIAARTKEFGSSSMVEFFSTNSECGIV